MNCSKNKGDTTQRGNYRGSKLSERIMKVFERVIQQKIREMVDVDAVQSGFLPVKGTADVIFIAHEVEERYLEKKKKLSFAFLDLEKAFDQVPREVVKWAMKKLGVDECLIRSVMAMYSDNNNVISLNNIAGNKFDVNVGVH